MPVCKFKVQQLNTQRNTSITEVPWTLCGVIFVCIVRTVGTKQRWTYVALCTNERARVLRQEWMRGKKANRMQNEHQSFASILFCCIPVDWRSRCQLTVSAIRFHIVFGVPSMLIQLEIIIFSDSVLPFPQDLWSILSDTASNHVTNWFTPDGIAVPASHSGQWWWLRIDIVQCRSHAAAENYWTPNGYRHHRESIQRLVRAQERKWRHLWLQVYHRGESFDMHTCFQQYKLNTSQLKFVGNWRECSQKFTNLAFRKKRREKQDANPSPKNCSCPPPENTLIFCVFHHFKFNLCTQAFFDLHLNTLHDIDRATRVQQTNVVTGNGINFEFIIYKCDTPFVFVLSLRRVERYLETSTYKRHNFNIVYKSTRHKAAVSMSPNTIEPNTNEFLLKNQIKSKIQYKRIPRTTDAYIALQLKCIYFYFRFFGSHILFGIWMEIFITLINVHTWQLCRWIKKQKTFEERNEFRSRRIRTDTCAQRGNNNEIIALSKQPSRQTNEKKNQIDLEWRKCALHEHTRMHRM